MASRTYTTTEIAELVHLSAEAAQLNAEIRELMVEVAGVLEAHGATYFGWEQDFAELAPLVEAMDTDKHPMATANTSYVPRAGDYWNSKWNPVMWAQRNKRTVRDIAHMRKALAACKETRR